MNQVKCPIGKHDTELLPLPIAYGIATKHDLALARLLEPPPGIIRSKFSWLTVGVVFLLVDLFLFAMWGLDQSKLGFYMFFIIIFVFCTVAEMDRRKENQIRKKRKEEWVRMIYCAEHKLAFDPELGWTTPVDQLNNYFQPRLHHGYDKHD